MRKLFLVTVALGTLSTPSITIANDTLTNVYISADFLSAEGDLGINDFGVQDITVTVDDADSAGRLTLGFQVNDFFAVEGSLTNSTEGGVTVTGDFDRIINGQRLIFDGTAKIKAEVDPLIFIGAKFTYPIAQRLNVNGVIGQVWWDVAYEGEALVSGSYGGNTFNIGERLSFGSDDGSDVYYGFGVSYEITNQVSADLEFFEAEVDDTDFEAYGAGLTYKF